MILVPVGIKDEVLKTVYKEAGLGDDAQGIAFSLPVSRTTTLKSDGPEKKEKKGKE